MGYEIDMSSVSSLPMEYKQACSCKNDGIASISGRPLGRYPPKHWTPDAHISCAQVGRVLFQP